MNGELTCFVALVQNHPSVTWRGGRRGRPSQTSTRRKRLAGCDSNNPRNPRLSDGLPHQHLSHVTVKARSICAAHLRNPSANQVPALVFQTLVPDGSDLHLDRPSRKLQLQVKLAVGTRQIMLTDTNRRHDQGQPGGADVKGVTIERRQTPRSVSPDPRIRQAQSERQPRAHTPGTTPIPDKTA